MDVDEALRREGQRWRARHPAPARIPDLAQAGSAPPRRRSGLVLSLATGVAVIVIVAVVVTLTNGLGLLSPVGGSAGTSSGQQLRPVHPQHGVVISNAKRCPRKDPKTLKATGADLRRHLVPPGATSVLLCRYYGSPFHTPVRLSDHHRVTAHNTVAHVAAIFDSFKAPPRTGAACPNERHANRVLAIFSYPQRRVVAVHITMFCTFYASNGVAAGVPQDPRAISQLRSTMKRLVPA